LGDGIKDERELCRSFVFRNFEAQMPFKTAKLLLEQRPGQFYIDSPVDEADDEVLEEIKKLQEKSRGYINPLTGYQAKSKAGLVSNIRNANPKEWEEAGKDLTKFLEKYS